MHTDGAVQSHSRGGHALMEYGKNSVVKNAVRTAALNEPEMTYG
jgi:hypothetical protein